MIYFLFWIKTNFKFPINAIALIGLILSFLEIDFILFFPFFLVFLVQAIILIAGKKYFNANYDAAKVFMIFPLIALIYFGFLASLLALAGIGFLIGGIFFALFLFFCALNILVIKKLVNSNWAAIAIFVLSAIFSYMALNLFLALTATFFGPEKVISFFLGNEIAQLNP